MIAGGGDGKLVGPRDLLHQIEVYYDYLSEQPRLNREAIEASARNYFWFIRLKNAPGFARGFSRHNSGVQWYLRMVCQRIHWSCLEKPSRALRGRNLKRDIQAPVRQWRVQAPDGSYRQGPFS